MNNDAWEIPDDLEPLSPNPGGYGSPDDLVGREQELARLHAAVVNGGAHVTGERRMGKSWLIRALREQLDDTVTAIYVSAETSSLDQFGQRLLAAMREHRLVAPRVARWEKQVGAEVTVNIRIAGITLSAKGSRSAGDRAKQLDVLDLLGSQPTGPVVLVIDEITHLCHALGPNDADEFLSGLRARRQAGRLPLVISGSIGLHHALDDFAPINDLPTVKVGSLRDDEAVILAARLLRGIGVEPTRPLADEIIRETSAIPFYIQAVVDRLQYRDDLDVAAVVQDCLTEGVWQTEHYVTRLDNYYGPEDAARARAILDVFALDERPLEPDVVLARAQARNPDLGITRDVLLVLLDKLEKDHYLIRENDADRMSTSLLARIWRHHRRLR